ncbi:LysR family transcriptional regulator [Luteibacter yeojuensis]|uniref:LysR family transcriptional regulator n=1 Tax=Luteibacter yeojuensis TaxID=345309 RepID=A0A0F3KV98_9GAMM|nr:LysR family transcriptional regulator [Luteibacter yeojuensis]KJV35185.1 LysR family transcriptional regulator [Luteibacter yeojuensis]
MDLLALADFNAVATHRGFGAASRATGRPKATLSRRVRELEDALGVRLVERGARPFRLTEEGGVLHAETAGVLGHIEHVAADLAAGAGGPRGRLRVSVPVLFAQRGVGRLASRYAAMYPAVELEIVADDRFVDPLAEGFDLIVRANPKPTTELAGRCFLRDRYIVAARPSVPKPRDGEAFPAIVLPAVSRGDTWPLVDGKKRLAIAPRAVLRLSSMSMVHDAVMEGVGAAMLPASLIAAALADGTLTAWGYVEGGITEVWALYPPQRHVAPKVSAFVNLLVDHFKDASPTHFEELTGST